MKVVAPFHGSSCLAGADGFGFANHLLTTQA
jgi:hypothetical protein